MSRVDWEATPHGWRAGAGSYLLLVNRATKRGGFFWEVNAPDVDDDRSGHVADEAEAMRLAEVALLEVAP